MFNQSSLSVKFIIFTLFFFSAVQVLHSCHVDSDCDFGELCQDDVCSNCVSDSDCSQEQVCDSSDLCVHKDLFDPFDGFDVLMMFVIAIGSALNASVGIGGGTLYMPLLLLLFFQDQEAVPLSNAMTTMAALAQVFINIRSQSPVSHKPLIDFDIALIVSPLSTGGTIIGSFIYYLLPVIILRLGLITFLIFLNIRIAKKARAEWAEFQDKQNGSTGYKRMEFQSPVAPEPSQNFSPNDEDRSLIPPKQRNVQGNTTYSTFQHQNYENFSQELKEILEQESKIPWDKILIICALFSVITTFSYTLKQDDWWTTVEYCGVGYWFLVLLLFPFLAAISFCIGRYFNLRHEKRKLLNYPFPEVEIRWTFNKVISVALFSILAGAMAALFGIGGGVLYVPMMMELGVQPEVYSATSGFLIVLTSLASFLTHSFEGHLLIEYAACFSAVSFVAAFIGVRTIKYQIKKSGKSFLVLIVLCVALTVSALALFIYTMTDMSDNFEKGSNPFGNFGSVC